MKLYNTPTKTIEDVTAQSGDELSVYTCGPTVYAAPHIGNWFTFVRYDMLVRALKLSGFRPKWVMNITDVGHLVSDADEGEDKLEKGAKREGKLLAYADGNVLIEETIKQKGKKAELVESAIPTENIAETKVLISFK